MDLVLNPEDSFGSGFWYLVEKASSFHGDENKLRDGNLDDFKDYVQNGIVTDWSQEREDWWTKANQYLNELAALRAIFMEDFKDVETRTAWNVKPDMPEFIITVRPTEDGIKDSVSVGLRVRLPKTYPRTAPQIQLVDRLGLSDSQVESAQKMIKDQVASLVGGEMIYELA
ncbi:eukaryotic translation initiation factor 2-alpha kinase, partial [Coemansia asiatica]